MTQGGIAFIKIYSNASFIDKIILFIADICSTPEAFCRFRFPGAKILTANAAKYKIPLHHTITLNGFFLKNSHIT